MANRTHYDIETLQARQAEVERQLDASRKAIAGHWDTLFSPPEEKSKTEHWMNQLARAVAVYDGVMTGYKLFRRFRTILHFLPKRKRKKAKR